ncbi:MAG: GAF domain-containing sensor histidine kinase [Desulfobacterales bacterium]|nr:MAG: GAF domain-containing sensor histidine kinase [Desulfobacterales bacterium]
MRLALGALTVLENAKILTLQPILFQNPRFLPSREYPDVLVPFLVCTAVIMISAFLITTVKISLRVRARELLRVSQELEASNAKLNALHAMVKEMALKTDLQELMDAAVRSAAKIMGVKACSIKLLEDDQNSLRFASTYGLSEDYLSKGTIDIRKSPINRKIIQGSRYVIGQIDAKDYFAYPEDIRKEGIASMLCLPLRVEKKIFGIFCVYSREPYQLGEADVDFFSLMTDFSALAIENLRSELTKSWFMMKAAHQLRAPLGAIYSMLKMVTDGYLGVINAKQEETIRRCQKRIEMLGNLIKDLLRLGEKRSEAAKPVLYPVSLNKVMMPLVDLYQTQALEHGLEIKFDIQDNIPPILANNRLIDDLFTNLISNAIKYTPRGGRVDVTLAGEGPGWVRFEVSDTGIGIAAEDKSRLFTEFFRTENAKKLVEEGTGLGLVIVKEILERLGGTIQVQSKIGSGSQFTCRLPSPS